MLKKFRSPKQKLRDSLLAYEGGEEKGRVEHKDSNW